MTVIWDGCRPCICQWSLVCDRGLYYLGCVAPKWRTEVLVIILLLINMPRRTDRLCVKCRPSRQLSHKSNPRIKKLVTKASWSPKKGSMDKEGNKDVPKSPFHPSKCPSYSLQAYKIFVTFSAESTSDGMNPESSRGTFFSCTAREPELLWRPLVDWQKASNRNPHSYRTVSVELNMNIWAAVTGWPVASSNLRRSTPPEGAVKA